MQPAASDVMRQSVEAGRIVDVPSSDTLSDATAGVCVRGYVSVPATVLFLFVLPPGRALEGLTRHWLAGWGICMLLVC